MPATHTRGEWAEHAIAVISELERHDDILDEHRTRIARHDTEIALLQQKAIMAGAIAGTLVSAILAGGISLIVNLLKG